MQGHSQEFENISRTSHTPICAADIIDETGKVTHQLVLHGGNAPADRQAAQMRSFDVDIIDADRSIDYEDLLFGKRLQLYRGVVTSSVDMRSVSYGTGTSWIPSGTSTGVLDGVKVDVDGSLVLGP